jgi:hypothetical protein
MPGNQSGYRPGVRGFDDQQLEASLTAIFKFDHRLTIHFDDFSRAMQNRTGYL